MIQHFLDTFIPTHTYKTELRVSAQEIRQFLLENNYSLSFRAFNEQVGCLGRTTHNLYAYSVPYLLTLTQDKQDEGLRRDKKNLKTLNYYGSKRRWAKEWNILLTLAYNLNCSNLVDCFAGSGFISLEASKLNIFNKIYLNEFSILVYNYLLTLQDDDTFKNFVAKISRRNFITKEGFEILKQEVYGLAGGVVYASTGRKRSLQTVNVEQAANYHLVNYFAYNGQGGYSSRKPLRTAGLEQTHNLLKNCSLSNYHYRKVMLQHIDDVNSLIVLDPPYLSKYREQANSYYVEFTDRQH
ncbi:MAG: hypothetical protein Q4F29_06455, partial [Lachnospiraceae bacterium]|nr:hypothetical protein [Lachnospiraceae bacterium]